jgi:RNA polymerase sigma factor (sigma-70 family)
MNGMEQKAEQQGLELQADSELVRQVAASKDAGAYAAIVRRHGAMVYRVCLRITHDRADAEDARQAAFIVLLQKAGAIRSGDSLMSWLHGVARRVSLGIVRDRERRMKNENGFRQTLEHETIGASAPSIHAESSGWLEADSDASPTESGETSHQAEREELFCRLDAELHALPKKLKEAVILRFLEDRSQKDAAEIAGCPQGTLVWRTKEGLDQLRKRLAKRSVVSAPALLPELLKLEAHAFAPLFSLEMPGAVLATTAAGAATNSARAMLLAQGVIKIMFWKKVAVVAAVLVGATAIVGGVLVAGGTVSAKNPGVPEVPETDAVVAPPSLPAEPAQEKIQPATVAATPVVAPVVLPAKIAVQPEPEKIHAGAVPVPPDEAPTANVYEKYGKLMSKIIMAGTQGMDDKSPLELAQDLKKWSAECQQLGDQIHGLTGGYFPAEGIKTIVTTALTERGVRLRPDADKELETVCQDMATGGNTEISLAGSTEKGMALQTTPNLYTFLWKLPSLVVPEDQPKVLAILSKIQQKP